MQHYRGAYLALEKIELHLRRINAAKASLSAPGGGDLSGAASEATSRILHPGSPTTALPSTPNLYRVCAGGYLLGYERSLWPKDVRASLALFPPPQALPASGALSVQALALTLGAAAAAAAADANGGCPAGDGRGLVYVVHEPQAQVGAPRSALSGARRRPCSGNVSAT